MKSEAAKERRVGSGRLAGEANPGMGGERARNTTRRVPRKEQGRATLNRSVVVVMRRTRRPQRRGRGRFTWSFSGNQYLPV